MTTDYHFTDDVESEETFQQILGQLITSSLANGIDVRGSWVIENGDAEGSDCEVMVFNLARTGETGT